MSSDKTPNNDRTNDSHDPKRRQVLTLSALGFAGVLAAQVNRTARADSTNEAGSLALSADSATATPVPDMSSFEALRFRYRRMLNSRTLDGSDASYYPPAEYPYNKLLEALDAKVTAYLSDMDVVLPPASNLYLWKLASPYEGAENMALAFDRIRVMALQYTSIGSSHYHSATLLDKIVRGLDKLYQKSYNQGRRPSDGGWYNIIGVPLSLLDTLCILPAAVIGQSLHANLLAVVDHFTPAPTDVSANLAWTTRVVLQRALLANDLAAFNNARSRLPALCRPEAPERRYGFLPDGSYLMHRAHPYTGAYGVEMYYQCAWMVHLLAGAADTALPPTDWAWLRNWTFSAFEPFLFRGSISGAIRGRAISRAWESCHAIGADFTSGAILLSDVAPEPEKTSLRQLVKATVDTDEVRDFFTYDPVTGLSKLTIDTARLGWDISTDDTITPRPEANATTIYAQMDRAAHRRPGFAYLVAMHSTRVTDYESINLENRHGWYTGSGMVYFHNSDPDRPTIDHYDDAFWATVNPYRLPGTTLDVRERQVRGGPASPGAPDYRQGVCGDSPMVGGVQNKTCGVACMRLQRDPDTVNPAWPSANKSWLFFSDFIVCMGSAIRSAGPYRVETIVENRNLGEDGGNIVLMNSATNAVLTTRGPDGTNAGEELAAKWISVQGVGGYVFLHDAFPQEKKPKIKGLRTLRSGNWRDVNMHAKSPDLSVSREYVTLWLDHGASPDDGRYCYVFFPNKTSPTSLNTSNITTICTNDVHYAVARFSTLTVYNAMFWNADTQGMAAGVLTAYAPVAVSIRIGAGQAIIAVSDPSQLRVDPIKLVVRIATTGVVSNDSEITSIVRSTDTVTLTFAPGGTRGSTKTAILSI